MNPGMGGDPGIGVERIETQFMRNSRVDLELYKSVGLSSCVSNANIGQNGQVSPEMARYVFSETSREYTSKVALEPRSVYSTALSSLKNISGNAQQPNELAQLLSPRLSNINSISHWYAKLPAFQFINENIKKYSDNPGAIVAVVPQLNSVYLEQSRCGPQVYIQYFSDAVILISRVIPESLCTFTSDWLETFLKLDNLLFAQQQQNCINAALTIVQEVPLSQKAWETLCLCASNILQSIAKQPSEKLSNLIVEMFVCAAENAINKSPSKFKTLASVAGLADSDQSILAAMPQDVMEALIVAMQNEIKAFSDDKTGFVDFLNAEIGSACAAEPSPRYNGSSALVKNMGSSNNNESNNKINMDCSLSLDNGNNNENQAVNQVDVMAVGGNMDDDDDMLLMRANKALQQQSVNSASSTSSATEKIIEKKGTMMLSGNNNSNNNMFSSNEVVNTQKNKLIDLGDDDEDDDLFSRAQNALNVLNSTANNNVNSYNTNNINNNNINNIDNATATFNSKKINTSKVNNKQLSSVYQSAVNDEFAKTFNYFDETESTTGDIQQQQPTYSATKRVTFAADGPENFAEGSSSQQQNIQHSNTTSPSPFTSQKLANLGMNSGSNNNNNNNINSDTNTNYGSSAKNNESAFIISRLQNQNEKLEQSLHALQQQNAIYSDKITEYQTTIETMKNDYEAADNHVESSSFYSVLESQQRLRKELLNARFGFDELSKKYEDLKRKDEENRKKLTEATKRLNEASVMKGILDQIKESYQNYREKTIREVNDLNVRLQAAEENSSMMKKKAEMNENIVDELQNRARDLENQLFAANSMLSRKDQEYNQVISGKDKEIQDRDSKIELLNAKYIKLKAVTQNLIDKMNNPK